MSDVDEAVTWDLDLIVTADETGETPCMPALEWPISWLAGNPCPLPSPCPNVALWGVDFQCVDGHVSKRSLCQGHADWVDASKLRHWECRHCSRRMKAKTVYPLRRTT